MAKKIRVTWIEPRNATVEIDGLSLPYLMEVKLDDRRLTLVQSSTGNIPGIDYWTPPESNAIGDERWTEYRVIPAAMSLKYEQPLVIEFYVQAAL